MARESVKRKLTTILAADVEGYSRLISVVAGARLTSLNEYREIIGSKTVRRATATLTPRPAVPRVTRPVNPSETRP